MVTKSVVVNMENSAEVRPVAMLVQIASKFESAIYIEKGNRSVNAKSIMGMMTMGFFSGEELNISVAGPDEEEALDTIVGYLTGDKQ